MKNTITHLPESKQEELNSIVELIIEKVKPEMIILFGSYSRGNWIEDTYKENGTTFEYKSDYDILVVTEKHQDVPPALGKHIRRRIKKEENLQTTPHIIFHDIVFFNKELEDGHYFFSDIVKEGTMLYSSDKFELAKPKDLSAFERAQKAKLYFTEWFASAHRFFEDYEHNFKKGEADAGYYKNAVFNLHQSAERYFFTIILVFTDYKPKSHDLDYLNRQAFYIDSRLKIVFPNQTDEEKRLFEILAKAYIDSRYKLGYTVAPADLQWLANRIQQLKELTEVICTKKIEEYLG